jgi:hypothetical protein
MLSINANARARRKADIATVGSALVRMRLLRAGAGVSLVGEKGRRCNANGETKEK